MLSLRPPGNARLILASRSPRRAELLRKAGYLFEQRESPFDDSGARLGGKSVEDTTTALAEKKAAALAERLESGIVLGADTLLRIDERSIGKPADAREARRGLQELIGRTHEVATAVCLIDPAKDRRRVMVDTASVMIDKVESDRLDRHIRRGAWRGKAGGYNLVDLQAEGWPISVRGDQTTVIGLPMERLSKELRTFAGIEAENKTSGSGA